MKYAELPGAHKTLNNLHISANLTLKFAETWNRNFLYFMLKRRPSGQSDIKNLDSHKKKIYIYKYKKTN